MLYRVCKPRQGKPRQTVRVKGELSLRLGTSARSFQCDPPSREATGFLHHERVECATEPGPGPPRQQTLACCPRTWMAEWMDPVGQRRRQGMGLPHCCFAGRLEDACPRGKPSASALLTRQCRVIFPRSVWIPTHFETGRAANQGRGHSQAGHSWDAGKD